MKVNEIFRSIDGEGKRAGEFATFIRLYSCNLNCSYCDTRYSCENNEYTEMTISEIVSKCKEFEVKNITLTGGEPLIHKDVLILIEELTNNGFEVNIETNGSIPLFVKKNKNIFFTMDYKSPSSNMEKFMLKDNFSILDNNDVLKFVVGSIEDLNKMKEIIHNNVIKAIIYISPVFGKITPAEIVNYLIDNELYRVENIHIQIQLHKIIWEPTTRGV